MNWPPTDLKASTGRALIKRFSMPRKPSKHDPSTRVFWQDDPDKWEEYKHYNRQDVVAEQAIWKKLAPYNMPRSEWEMWFIDQEINQAGIPVNSGYVENAMQVFADFKRTRLARMADLTGLENPNSNAQILPWLQENGYVFDDLRAPHVARGLERAQEEGRDDLAAVLALRQQVSKTSPTKYAALDRLMDREGGVIRNAFQFAGAGRTWRWAGRGYQAQNLPRPAKSLEKGIAIHAANLGRLSLEEIELLYDDPMELLKAGIRPAAQAPEGYTFIDADLNAIENRVLGWIANDVKILDVFRHGKDPYIDFACDLYEQPYDKLMAEYKAGNGSKRTIAKPGVLGCFGADTPVLTPRGWVRIVDLRHDDKVHDGETWVPHEGVAYMGQKDVLSLSQVYVTPDHEIEIEEEWETCQQVIQQNAMPLALASANGKLRSSSAHHAARARSTGAGASAAWNAKLGDAISRSARHHSAIAARKKPVGAISEFELVPICSTPSRVVSTLREIGVRTPTSEVIVTTAGGEYVAGSTTRKSGFPIFATNSTRGLSSRLIRRWRSTGSTTTGTTNREISNSPLGSKTSETRATVYDVVNAGPRHRFVIMTADGPIIVSNCGYMLGPGKKVVNKDTGEPEGTGLLGYAWNMGVTEFTPEQAELSVKKWREKYQTVVSFWYDFENAFRRCISSREPQEFACFRFDWSGPFVRMRLPSGRFLHYCRPRIENLMMPWGKMKMSITYEQQNEKNQWARVSTHPGKVTENCWNSQTQILTDRGVLRIVEVRSDDQVWDGQEWVQHDGVVYSGERETIDMGGAGVTPEHQIDVDGSWLSASSVSPDTATRSFERHHGNATRNAVRERAAWVEREECVVADRVRLRGGNCARSGGGNGEGSSEILRLQSSGCNQPSETDARNDRSPGLCGLAFNACTVRERKSSVFSQLRSAGIKVCESWHDFSVFWHDMRATYARGLTLERVDNEQGYSAQNCAWVDRKSQGRKHSFQPSFRHAVGLDHCCGGSGAERNWGRRRCCIDWT